MPIRLAINNSATVVRLTAQVQVEVKVKSQNSAAVENKCYSPAKVLRAAINRSAAVMQ
jgi:hypothetical protein